MKFDFSTSSQPVYDTWQPEFQAPDLVIVINTPNISPHDKWVVCGRVVDEDGQEWYYLRPGYSNQSAKNRIKVTGPQMKRTKTN